MSPENGKPPDHFIVFIPGYMGSKLRDRKTGEIVWVDLPTLLSSPFKLRESLDRLFQKMLYPNPDLEPAGIVDQVIFVPPLFKQEQYGRMLTALEKMGYQIDPPAAAPGRRAAYTFCYDWRQDNRISARQLAKAVDGWSARHPGAEAWLIGHSNGGIVSRWYIEKEGGKDKVGRLFLMGSPWDGAPKAIQAMQSGLDAMFARLLNMYYDVSAHSQEIIRSFPSFYQLIPTHNPFLRDVNNNTVDLFANPAWLENDTQRQMLADAKQFNDDLGTTLSVETLCFFGVKKPTTTGGQLYTEPGGAWQYINWDQTTAGDGTVPERSAVHPQAREKLPFSVGHGDIYINPSVLEKLEWELLRKYELGVLAEAKAGNLHVTFEPGADGFGLGQMIWMRALVEKADTGEPVFDAQIDASLVWREPLPISELGSTPPDNLPSVRLQPSAVTPGEYLGDFYAPHQAGYYAIQAVVKVPGEPDVLLSELIVIEPMPMAGPPEDDVQMAEPPAEETGTSGAEPPEETSGEDSDNRGGTLSDNDEAAPPEDRSAEPPEPGKTNAQEPVRYINAQVEDHPETDPLVVGDVYTLAFGVDKVAAAASVVFESGRAFLPEEQMVELKVYLSSKDFYVHTSEPQTLRLPRQGKSKNKARFDIEPKRQGMGEITALFYKANNFIQGVTVQINVGEPAKGGTILGVQSLGRPPHGAFAVEPRDLSLFIKKTNEGFNLTLVGAVQAETSLRLTVPQVNRLAADLRQKLLDIVYLWKSGDSYLVFQRGQPLPQAVNLFFQSSLDIPPDVSQESLKRLAKAGWLLYYDLFYSNNDPGAAHMGDVLRQMAKEATLKIQIVSQEFMLPWGLLYMAEQYDPNNVDWEMFLGFRHIIEHIPLQERMSVHDSTIHSQPTLSISLNLNTDIEYDMGGHLISKQQMFWNKIAQACSALKLETRVTDDQFFDALNNPATADQLIYFYGHARSNNLDDPSGPNGSSMTLSGKKKVTLEDLKWRAPATRPLPGSPLVFINACESAELSPLFYDGFMPYFTAKGARGMIGSECEVPALFGVEWASRFFTEFLGGQRSLGEVFLSLRREFYEEHNNPLGLLYALYCDGDTRISPGLMVP